jgi:hypothetical protein
MIDQSLRNLQVLQKADALIAKIWVNHLARRLSLFAFAALIGAFAIGMANVAVLFALQPASGIMWSAAIVALLDLGMAALVLMLAANSKPGPEMDLAFETRQMAVEAVQNDAREFKHALDALGQEMRSVKANVTQLVENPLDVAAQKLLIPAALSILKGVRSKKEHG